MRRLMWFFALLIGLTTSAVGQVALSRRTPEEFGFRHLVVMFGRDSVDVLVQSEKGEEQKRKPLLLWVQGSLPTPLVLYDEKGPYPVFPFRPKAVLKNAHLVVVGKPGIPLTANVQGRNPNQLFRSGAPPLYYCQRNYLDYYVRRNQAVLRYLKKQPWVEAKSVTVAGHSEGSTIAANLAAVPGLVSRAVYLSGNPLGRMLSNAADARRDQAAGDTSAVPRLFRYWRDVVAAPTRIDCTPGDHNRATYEFSAAPMASLLRARVPLFIGFGSLDKGIAGDDYLRLEVLRLHKTNFTFREYVGREHNFFGFKDGQVNYDDFYWNQVGEDFLHWAGLLPNSN